MNWVLHREYANSPESRAILLVAMLGSDHVIRARLDDLDSDLDARDANPNDVPVGSVEFVQTYADWVGVVLPDPVDYPEDLCSHLRRTIRRMPISDAPRGTFVKPVETKRFSAIRCYDPASPPTGVSPSTLCWVSDPVEFGAEYMYALRSKSTVLLSRGGQGRGTGINAPILSSPEQVYQILRAQVRVLLEYSCDFVPQVVEPRLPSPTSILGSGLSPAD